MIFPTERALCESLAQHARAQGWTVYPETDGWDLLLVAPDGAQLGIEAKLRPNLRVLAQAAAKLARPRGPRWIATATGRTDPDFAGLAVHIGLVELSPPWPADLRDLLEASIAHFFKAPAWLPRHASSVNAGVPHPERADRWKEGALRLLARLEVRGTVTTADLVALEVATDLWFGRRWLASVGTQSATGRTLYALGPQASRPRRWVEANVTTYAELLAEERAQWGAR